MIREGFVSLGGFLLGLGNLSYFQLQCILDYYNFAVLSTLPLIMKWNSYCILLFCVISIILYLFYTKRKLYFQIAFRSHLLGSFCGWGIILTCVCTTSYKPFGYYIIILSVFHFTEYLVTAYGNPKNLSLESFLINHSIAYCTAAVMSWIEFFCERWLYSNLKEFWYATVCGIAMCIFGDIVRKVSIIKAGTNFNHIVQTEHHAGHELVTTGIYSIFRHPSYVGWFWWSIGTQLILVNPICFIAYSIASWMFFNDRVKFEEFTLIKFFGRKYINYQKSVGTGLPFIKGFVVDS